MLHAGGAPAFLCRGPQPCASAFERCACRKAAGRAYSAPTPKRSSFDKGGQTVEKPPSARAVPRRGGGREPCHSPKYFGQPHSSLPTACGRSPSQRGQGVGTLFGHAGPPLTREAFSFWHIFSSFCFFGIFFDCFAQIGCFSGSHYTIMIKYWRMYIFTARLLRL